MEKNMEQFPLSVKKNPYSIDLNLLGRSVEAGPLEDPFEMPSEEVFGITSSISHSPNEPDGNKRQRCQTKKYKYIN